MLKIHFGEMKQILTVSTSGMMMRRYVCYVASLVLLIVTDTAKLTTTEAFTVPSSHFLCTRPSTTLLSSSSPSSASESTESTVADLDQQEPLTALPTCKLPQKLKYTPEINSAGCDVQAWKRSYFNTEETRDPESLLFVEDEGLATTLPKDFPSGTWFRNGAGRFVADDGERAMHPFDGDGMIMKVVFDNDIISDDVGNAATTVNGDGVHFTNRYIQTEKYLNDKETGKMTKRGTFGTNKSGGWLANIGDTSPGNIANTACVLAPSTNSLYALWEGGQPHILDPHTLEMKNRGEEYDFDGALRENQCMSAHYRYDPHTNTHVNFGVSIPPSETSKMYLFEHDADTYKLKPKFQQKRLSLEFPGAILMHDFILTEHYCIFAWIKTDVNPIGGLRALLGVGPFVGALKIDENSPATLVVVPRSLFDLLDDDKNVANGGEITIDVLADERIMRIPIPYYFNFHFSNAYEETDTNLLVFDMVRIPAKGFDFVGGKFDGSRPTWDVLGADDIPCSELARYTVNLDTQQLDTEPTILCTQSPEFPTVPTHLSTKPHRYVYTVASRTKPIDGAKPVWGASSALTKVDAAMPGIYETWAFDPDEMLGEPTVVRKKNANAGTEDACYVMTTASKMSTQTADLVIFDVEGPEALERGPVCRLRLPHILSNGSLHGKFYEGQIF